MADHPDRPNNATMQDIFDLEERITDLEAALRAMTNEVRTQRVVVAAEDGFERVVIEDKATSGGVDVFSREGGNHTRPHASMIATEEVDGGDASFYISNGNALAGITMNRAADGPAEGRMVGEVYVMGPDGERAGMELTHEGVKLAAARLYREQQRNEGR